MVNKMCGILGVIVNKPVNIKANLEKIYRNQRSRGTYGCGIAKMSYRNTLTRHRGVASDSLFQDEFDNFYRHLQHQDRLIVHHRYASHGGDGSVLESNHPFIDENFNTALIHNGVISNYAELYKELRFANHRFESELRLLTKHNIIVKQQITDSEVILHMIDKNPIAQADELAKVNGSCAIAVLNKRTSGILLYRWYNPIIVSKDEHGNYYFSSEFTDRLGLEKVASLDEGALYRLSLKGLEKLHQVRKSEVYQAPKSYTKTETRKTEDKSLLQYGNYRINKDTEYGNYRINKDTGIWEEIKKSGSVDMQDDDDFTF